VAFVVPITGQTCADMVAVVGGFGDVVTDLVIEGRIGSMFGSCDVFGSFCR